MVKVPLPGAKPWDGAVLWGQAWAGFGQNLALGWGFVKGKALQVKADALFAAAQAWQQFQSCSVEILGHYPAAWFGACPLVQVILVSGDLTVLVFT